VAIDCTPHAARMALLALPGLRQKGDVSEWFDAGHTPTDLEARADVAAPWDAKDARIAQLEQELTDLEAKVAAAAPPTVHQLDCAGCAERERQIAALRADVAELERLPAAILKGQQNRTARQELQTLRVLGSEYAYKLREGKVDADGYADIWLGVPAKISADGTSAPGYGLAAATGYTPKTVKLHLERWAKGDVLDLRKAPSAGGDPARTRYQARIHSIAEGRSLTSLLEETADFKPHDIQDGTRQPWGVRACPACGATGRTLHQTDAVKVQRVRLWEERCADCDHVLAQGRDLVDKEPHLQAMNRRAPIALAPAPDDADGATGRDYRLKYYVGGGDSLPVADELAVESAGSPEVPAAGEPPVETTGGSPPIHCERCGRPTLPNGDRSCECVYLLDAPPYPVLEVNPDPPAVMASGPPLPPRFDHWCAGAHQFPVPPPPKVERCSGCQRTWRPLDEVGS
jgi:hypothetical protein